MIEQTTILERLERGVVIGAEGYLFELERRGYLQAGPYVPEVVLEYPEVVAQLHLKIPPDSPVNSLQVGDWLFGLGPGDRIEMNALARHNLLGTTCRWQGSGEFQ